MCKLLIMSMLLSISCSILAQNDRSYKCGKVVERNLESIQVQQVNGSNSTSYDVSFEVLNVVKDPIMEKIIKCKPLLEKVMNDPRFWMVLTSYEKYQDVRWTGDGFFGNARTIPVDSIQLAFMNEWNPKITLATYGSAIKFPWSTANAYTTAPNGTIKIKRYYAKSATVVQLAGTILHELFHIRGFIHQPHCSEKRDYSVPYVVDRVFEEILANPN